MADLYDDRIPVHYGFIYLVSGSEEPGDLLLSRRGQANGLLGAREPHQLAIVTGLHTGEVPLRIEWLAAAPAASNEWEEIVEASVDLPSREAMLSSFEEFIELELPQPGWHRARLSATGMDAGKELDTTDEDEPAPDRYLLQLWPAVQSADQVVRQSSEIAAYWHAVARGERG